MVVYADVIWLLNVCIDFLLLLLTAVILKRKAKKWRLLAGALLGSSIVIFTFTPFAYAMTHPVTKIFYSIAIVYAAFGFTRVRTFVQTLFMFYFVTFMVGGGLIGLHFFVQASPSISEAASVKTASFGDPVSWLFVCVGFPVIYYFSKKRIGDIEITKIRYEHIVKVELVIGDMQAELSGLIDNGNQLYDPLTKTPVMIVEVSETKNLFPEWLQEQAKKVTHFPNLDDENSEWMKRLRIIPYRGIGQSNQFLLAVKPDAVRIHKDGEVLSVHHVLVGLSHTKLSSDNEYTCIIHPKMLLSTTA
ncbi:sigma-E processing peptidase SpoIIGA [Ectobacillus panaciterrae]|uniref:sigma-E processing peptidase SpoIIGA n=1 Tax=Ectobacillus panaciterrae TaxID=363872 RepID=UPI0004076D0A|nr:sigma-E processing peptidase SpoIIGA [Ectobacillus panaciterrae]